MVDTAIISAQKAEDLIFQVSKLWGMVIYQIYPRSFQDASGDGSGDLQGITQRLPYFKEGLPVDGIWLSPIYPSPLKDNGYDISDYTDISSMYGNLEDFDQMIKEAHGLGLQVMMDMVPNHTSNQHQWFRESHSSKDNAKHDWYIWRDPKPDGSPPNNWISVAGGSAWEFDKKRGQYYLHSFLKEQPDLNWRSPEVVEAMLQVMRFWLDHGVDGFRVDVAYYIIKDNRFLDEPLNELYKEGVDHPNEYLKHIYSKDQPEAKEILSKMAKEVSRRGKFIVTEVYVSREERASLYQTSQEGAHLPFNFDLISPLSWNAASIKESIDHYLSLLRPQDVPTWVIGNHDQSRVATRLGGQKQARLAAMLQMTLPGIAFIYNGEEIGMSNVPVPEEMRNDTFEVNRDEFRTPMQWDDSPSAGFTKANPWLPVASNYPEVNVASEMKDEKSMLSLYRKLLILRKADVFKVGKYRSYSIDEKDVFIFYRELDTSTVMVILNFSVDTRTIRLKEHLKAHVLLNTSLDMKPKEEIDLSEFVLQPEEGYIVTIEKLS